MADYPCSVLKAFNVQENLQGQLSKAGSACLLQSPVGEHVWELYPTHEAAQELPGYERDRQLANQKSFPLKRNCRKSVNNNTKLAVEHASHSGNDRTASKLILADHKLTCAIPYNNRAGMTDSLHVSRWSTDFEDWSPSQIIDAKKTKVSFNWRTWNPPCLLNEYSSCGGQIPEEATHHEPP